MSVTDSEQIPTVSKAQAAVDLLKEEYSLLLREQAALRVRAAEVEYRLSKIKGYSSGELNSAEQRLLEAQRAEKWDALPVIVEFADSERGAERGEVKEGRLLKVTPKQIHVLTQRGRDRAVIFDRETGKEGRGGHYSARILNLEEVLAAASKVPRA